MLTLTDCCLVSSRVKERRERTFILDGTLELDEFLVRPTLLKRSISSSRDRIERKNVECLVRLGEVECVLCFAYREGKYGNVVLASLSVCD